MAKNYISNKDETVRMFSNHFLEAFSKVHWSFPLFIFSSMFRLSPHHMKHHYKESNMVLV